MTVKVALTVPELPSVTVTSLIESAGVVVVSDGAQALPVGDRRVRRVREVDEERLVRLVEQVAVDRTVTVFVVWPGVKVSVPFVAV